jgi:hypothetical protein
MSTLASRYQAVRDVTRSLAARISVQDQMVQSCPEAGPVKWHQAHTTWITYSPRFPLERPVLLNPREALICEVRPASILELRL